MKDEPTRGEPVIGPLDADQKAVEAVIAREIDAFFGCDFETWSECYLHSDRLRSTMMSHELGLDVREGWEAHREGTRLHFEAGPVTGAQWKKVTEQVVVSGDTAWLTCRAYTDTTLCMMGESYETWILERHDGAWKVVCVNVMAVRAMKNADRRIAVDAESRVVGLTLRAERNLAAHPAFAIRNGRLRAVDRDVDRDLQAAVARAGALHGYFEQAAFAEAEGQRFATPLVLERADGAGHEIVMLTVQDRLTYLEFDTPTILASRVDMAAAVFGLSGAQQRVAGGIAAGQSLPEIAADLGIRPATAKTHLQRIYQKTGTNTKTALLRTLLTVG